MRTAQAARVFLRAVLRRGQGRHLDPPHLHGQPQPCCGGGNAGRFRGGRIPQSVVEVRDRQPPAALGRQRGRPVQHGGGVRSAGDSEDDGGAIGDMEALHALGQGFNDPVEGWVTT